MVVLITLFLTIFSIATLLVLALGLVFVGLEMLTGNDRCGKLAFFFLGGVFMVVAPIAGLLYLAFKYLEGK